MTGSAGPIEWHTSALNAHEWRRRLRGELSEGDRHDLGMTDSVEAEAIGVPGKRTFKITATSAGGSAVVWLEKEQLLRVGIAIKRFLVAHPGAAEPVRPATQVGASGAVEVEFKAGEMSLRHDTSTGVLTLAAEAIEPAPEPELPESEKPPAAVQFSFTRPMAATLADLALEACAAGRKPCPLCGGPIDPEGHFCVKTNGHQTLDLPSE